MKFFTVHPRPSLSILHSGQLMWLYTALASPVLGDHISESRFLFYDSLLKSSNLREADDLDYISNGIIKLGVLKNAGGSVGYLSDAHNDINIINRFDKGREVQLSYYADPVNYRPDVCGKVTPWKVDWPWNPIGSGDVYGHQSQILNYTKTDNSIVVVTRPLQWACNNLACECEFRTNYTLVGNAIHINATLTNHRTDGAPIVVARDQEEPAVYTTGRLGKLFSYIGNAPFKGEAMYEFPKVGGPPWVPGGFQATENWAAFVQSEPGNFGLGVYHPRTSVFLAGFSGTVGHGGPLDPDTGYIAPLETRVINARDSYSFECWLILGNLKDIRSFVYQLRGLVL